MDLSQRSGAFADTVTATRGDGQALPEYHEKLSRHAL